MSKKYLGVTVLLGVSLVVTLIYMLAYLTQAANIQVVAFQCLYWSLDRVSGIAHTIVYLLVSFITSTLAIVFRRQLKSKLNTQWLGYILLFSTGGVILGLLVHYADVCCDSPVIFRFGFPLSWIRGITNSWHFLPTSPTIYLIQNFSNFKWDLVLWNLVVSFMFWFDAGFMLFAARNLRWDSAPA